MHIGIFYRDYDSAGGMPREWRRLASQLSELGERVTVYTYGIQGRADDTPDAVVVNRFYSKRLLRLPRSLVATLARDSAELDILEIVGGYFLENIGVARVAKKLAIPYIFAPLGHLAPNLINRSPAKKRLFINLFLRGALRDSIGLHCLSELDQVSALKYADRPVVRTTFGSFTEDVPNSLDEHYLRTRLSLSGEHIVVLYLGRLDAYWKGLATLIESFGIIRSRCPECHLVFIGPDQEGGLRRLERQVRTANLGEQVHFLDAIWGARKFDALASADILVCPSRMECIPRTVREALAVGCPVLISEATHAADIVTRYSAGAVTPVEAESMAEILLGLVRDPNRLRVMRANARRASMEGFNWENEAIALRNGFKNLLAADSA